MLRNVTNKDLSIRGATRGHNALMPKFSLVREWINSALYCPTSGYFVQREVIATPQKFIDFPKLLGKSEYQRALSSLYKDSPQGWMTPVEVFAPHYSYAIAKYMLSKHEYWQATRPLHFFASNKSTKSGLRKEPLVIYELGGGNGTHAKHVCDFIRAENPSLYRDNFEYNTLEISSRLKKRQEEALLAHRKAKVAKSLHADGTRLSDYDIHDDRSCFLVALEVLDNLVHDKVVCFKASEIDDVALVPGVMIDKSDPHTLVLLETVVEECSSTQDPTATTTNRSFRERYRPVSDPYILRTLMVYLCVHSTLSKVDLIQLLERIETRTVQRTIGQDIAEEVVHSTQIFLHNLKQMIATLPLEHTRSVHSPYPLPALTENEKMAGISKAFLEGLSEQGLPMATTPFLFGSLSGNTISQSIQSSSFQVQPHQSFLDPIYLPQPPMSKPLPLLQFKAALDRSLSRWNQHVPPPPTPPGFQWAQFLPTGAFSLFQGANKVFPQHHLVLADFDYLPEPKILPKTVASDCRVAMYAPALGSPITASKDPNSRNTVDHQTYLSAKPGTADIFFPTDFAVLQRVASVTTARDAAFHSRHVATTIADSSSKIISGSEIPDLKQASPELTRWSAYERQRQQARIEEGERIAASHGTAGGNANGITGMSKLLGVLSKKLDRKASEVSDTPAEWRLSPAAMSRRGALLDTEGVRVVHSWDFLKKHANTTRTETLTGFNPLLDDYGNTQFLLS